MLGYNALAATPLTSSESLPISAALSKTLRDATLTSSGSVAWPSMASLADNFDDNVRDVSKWTIGNPGGGSTAGTTVSEVNNRLEISHAANTVGYSGYVSLSRLDLTGSAAAVRLSIGGTYTNQRSLYTLHVNSTNYFGWVLLGTSLRAAKVISGQGTTYPFIATYDPTIHAWLRIRESGGNTYWDTAPSTADNPPAEGQWVNRHSEANPLAVTALQIGLVGGVDTTTVSNPSITAYDGFNTASSNVTLVSNLVKTLRAATSTSDADVTNRANLDKTLRASTLNSSISVGSSPVNASVSKTLRATTLSTDVDIINQANLVKTLRAATASTETDVIVVANLSKTLRSTTLSTDVDVTNRADLSKTLRSATLNSSIGSGPSPINASASKTLRSATLSSDTDVSNRAVVTANLRSTTIVSEADVTVKVDLVGSLRPATSSTDVVLKVNATVSKTLNASTIESFASTGEIPTIVANMVATLAPMTILAIARQDQTAYETPESRVYSVIGSDRTLTIME